MPERKKLLLIGDSISIGYFPHLAKLLEGEYRVLHNEGNAGDSRNLLANLDRYLEADGDADLIHFNCGLHDIRRPRDGSGIQVPPLRYRENLTRIVARLKQTGRKLVWASTTPVIFERHRKVKSFDRREEDVQDYNAAANEIITEARVGINDLHTVTLQGGLEQHLCEDGVHFTDQGYALLASAVVRIARQGM